MIEQNITLRVFLLFSIVLKSVIISLDYFRMELIMKVRYNNLFKLLIDKKMKKTDLAREAGLTPATLARLSKDEIVSMETIVKICECLNCRIEDVVELVPDNN